VVVLALGGASWPRLGSDGSWLPWLQAQGVPVAALRPANCGFDVAGSTQRAASCWSEHFASRFAGEALKSVALELRHPAGDPWRQIGEFVVTAYGIEGSLVYAASSRLREAIDAAGSATLYLDLLPARSLEWVRAELAHPRGSRSLSTHLKTRLGLAGVKAGLLYELLDKTMLADAPRLAAMVKALPLVRFEALDAGLMLIALPGVFCAGEMLDWEAPTGGYLLSACLASGLVAGDAARDWLRAH
jgi:predicted flavoprotein YhiN